MGTRIDIRNHNHEWRLLRMDKKHNRCKMPRRKVWQCTYIGCDGRKYESIMCPCEKLPGKEKK